MQKNYGDGSADNWNVIINKIVLGHYDSAEQAEAAGAVDVTSQVLNGYKTCYGGDGVDFTVLKKARLSSTFPIAYDTLADKITVRAIEQQNSWIEYTDAPIIGSIDPWFRITGAYNNSGEPLDTYVVENGKSINIDTMYGYGYQTMFMNKDIDSFIPEFFLLDENKEFVRDIYVNGEKFYKGDAISFSQNHTEYNDNIIEATFNVVINEDGIEHVKNYIVRFVKRTAGSNAKKLYVAGPVAPEIRSVFLDEYFEYKHDIFIANVSDAPLTNLHVELDATNVALDSYWTIGGAGNNILAPCPNNFAEIQMSSVYGELPNVAKIRLVPDGDKAGDIEGTLKIYSGEELLETIVLSGHAQNPQIVTDVELKSAVKYVPYSYMITTNNMYDWNSVKYEISDADNAALEELGLHFYPETGELYGAPLEATTVDFTVKAVYGRDDIFEPSIKKFTLNVLDNEDERVFKTSNIDDGYFIIPLEKGIIGYVGEQVSDYRFEVTTFEEDDIYHLNPDYNSEFKKLWLNGQELTDGYDVDNGSTKITVKAQTIQNNDQGRNTISAEYNVKDERGEHLKLVSQNYYINIKPQKEPTEKPEEPTVKPEEPTVKPDEPTTEKPTEPVEKPDKPAGPIQKPDKPTEKPDKPTEESDKPTGSTEKPNSSTTKPGSSTANPNGESNNEITSTPSSTAPVSGKITLRVKAEDQNNTPLGNVELELHSTPKTVVTDNSGNALFEDVEFGTHTIYVKKSDGEEMISKNFEIVAGNSVGINGDKITVSANSDILLKIKVNNGEISFEDVTLSATPKTGDNTNIALWITLLLLALAGIGVAMIRVKSRKY